MDITLLLLYATLAGAYLVVLPAVTYAYLNSRWYIASSPERVLMYGLMFFLFPGMLLLSPFLNFRPKRRVIEA